MRISDSNSQSDNNVFGSSGYVSVPREIYNRLQTVSMFPLGSRPEDLKFPIKAFIDAMEKIQDHTNTNTLAAEVDSFFGLLGITEYYPHPDNTYKGELFNA